MTEMEREPIMADEHERPALQKIEKVLNHGNCVPKLVGPDGEEIELPVSVFRILRQIIFHMTRGRAISIVPFNKELSTYEAADILNTSTAYLIKLLDQGDIPFVTVGTHRHVRFSDLMDYKKHRDEKRRQGLAEILHLSEDMGLYD